MGINRERIPLLIWKNILVCKNILTPPVSSHMFKKYLSVDGFIPAWFTVPFRDWV